MALSHLGQREFGSTTDLSAGSRAMQTFRKLPTIKPRRMKKKSGSNSEISIGTISSSGRF
jgi:hypothetical protein